MGRTHKLNFTFHKEHDTTRFLQLCTHFFNGMGSNDFGPFSLICKEIINLICSPVMRTYYIPMIIHVKDNVLAHNGQTNQGDIGSEN